MLKRIKFGLAGDRAMLGYETVGAFIFVITLSVLVFGGIAWLLYESFPDFVSVVVILGCWGFAWWLTVPIGEYISYGLAAVWAGGVTLAFLWWIGGSSGSGPEGGGMDGANY
jgi:Na+-transporting NADH:ubiquinone oxidoreductase subunit NqrE